MTADDLIGAWKDPDRRAGDIDHPAGEITLDDAYDEAVGGNTEHLNTIGCSPCVGYTVPARECFAYNTIEVVCITLSIVSTVFRPAPPPKN